MTRLAALLLVLLAAPASALTPEELWAAWQAQAASYGRTLDAEAVPGEGGALTLRAIMGAMAGRPPEPIPPESPVQEVALRPTGDGGVAIDLGLPESLDVPTADPTLGDVRVESRGLSITARDDEGGAIRYEVAAASLRGASLPPVDGPEAAMGAAEVTGLQFSFSDGPGADGVIEASLSVDGYAYVMDPGEAAMAYASRQSSRSEGRITGRVALVLPEGVTLAGLGDGTGEAFLDALERGLSLRLDLTSEAIEQAAWMEGFPFSYSYESRGEPSQAVIEADRSGASIAMGYGGSAGTISVPEVGIEGAEIVAGPFGLDLLVPLGPEPGEFRYGVTLEGVEVGEAAWAALDPRGLLPRGPFSLDVDVGGRANVDLAGIAAAERLGATPPVPSIESLEVRVLDMAAAGVAVSATGSFTFDNASGVPVPVGAASARVEGLDRLIDAVVALGWATEEDARGARLGLAMAFRAGDGPDTRVMELEARPGGQVFVNGRQVR